MRHASPHPWKNLFAAAYSRNYINFSDPKDPADRIITATALVEGMSLLTADGAIRRSKAFHTIWLMP